MKKSLLALLMVSLLALTSFVSALNENNNQLAWGSLRINGDFVEDGDVLAVEEGQTLEIRVGIEAQDGASDVEVDAKISGYEYSDYENIQDSTHLFDVQAGNTKYVNLEVTLPTRLEKDEYLLRLRIMDRDGNDLERDIRLSVEPTRHGVQIADVVLSPGTTVKAGRSVLATVLLENLGDKEEDDVKVTVAIPELGVIASEFVDVVETDNHNVDREDVPEMFLPIPADAAAGEYQVRVTAQYDDLRETATKTMTIRVVANEMFAPSTGKLVLAVGPEMQAVAAGSTATYGVALTNDGRTSKAYVVEAVTGDWATVRVSESLVVLEPGKNKVVYVEVTPKNDAPVGEHTVSVSVRSGNDVLETVPLKAIVTGPQKDAPSLRNGLEIALIVLIVLLVIIGLIIGFSRLKKDDEEEKTYY